MAHRITTEAELDALYGPASEISLLKETDRLTPEYRAFIEAAPFFALATRGPEGLDCTPRGDRPGFVRILDDRTLVIPDRRGNNRIDSLRNIVRDPSVGLLFLIPGIGETIRVNGRAAISTEPALLDSFAVDEKAPRTALVVTIEAVYFQCSKAIIRSRLWDPETRIERAALPSAGQILATITGKRIGGPAYDAALAERIRTTLY